MSITEKATNVATQVAAAAGIQHPAIHGNAGQEGKPAVNKAVVYNGTQKVIVSDIGYPRMQDPQGKPMKNGVILKVLLGCICGSDLHAYNGRSTALAGKLVFGHEITGEIVEVGQGVNAFEVGDWVSVPFNLSCGVCRQCKEQNYHACLTTNIEAPGVQCGIPGYPLSGGWQGGQAQYVFIPHADFQLLKLPDSLKSDPQKMLDVAMLADIWPTAHHGTVEAKVRVGSSVYIAGAGPVGLLALLSAKAQGAAVVFVGDVNPDRLPAVSKLGGIPVNLKELHTSDLSKLIKEKTGQEFVDCSVECVGFEASGHGKNATSNHPMEGLDTCIHVTKAAGNIGVIGVFLPQDPKGPSKEFIQGKQPIRFGEGWIKGVSIHNGQAPVQRYNAWLLEMIMHDQVHLADVLNTVVINIDDAPEAYKNFVDGKYIKYVIDPNNIFKQFQKKP